MWIAAIISEQVERVFRFFPRDQVRVIKFEEFPKTTPETVNEVFRFSWR